MIAPATALRPPLLDSATAIHPSPGPVGEPLDVIFIEGYTGHTVIGIHASELHQPQPLLIDVHAGVQRVRACTTDRIADTIDYSVVRERLQRLMRDHRLQLLEAFAEAVADILLGEFGARWVRVKVVKPNKFDDVQAVGVVIERRAEHRGVLPAEAALRPAPAPGATVLQWIGAGMVPGRGG